MTITTGTNRFVMMSGHDGVIAIVSAFAWNTLFILHIAVVMLIFNGIYLKTSLSLEDTQH
ncbi:MAG: hypothetical protein PHX51_08190 [Clostridia bacterium]|nr:hypothetical protein [Clostridia bacterium]